MNYHYLIWIAAEFGIIAGVFAVGVALYALFFDRE